MKAQALIKESLRLIGVTRAGQTPSTDVLAEGLATLNSMIDAWTIERLMVPVIARRVVDLVVGQQTYTMGVSGDWDEDRPARIERAGLIDGDTETPLDIWTLGEWADQQLKSTSGSPRAIYYEPTYPLGTVRVWPVPDGADQLALYVWAPLAQFADLNTTEYDLPPGYAAALKFNLAVELMPGFADGRNKSTLQQMGLVRERATEAKAWIKRFNEPVEFLKCDAALVGGGSYNVLTGRYE